MAPFCHVSPASLYSTSLALCASYKSECEWKDSVFLSQPPNAGMGSPWPDSTWPCDASSYVHMGSILDIFT